MIYCKYSLEASELFKLSNSFDFNFNDQLLAFAADAVKTVMHFKIVNEVVV
jgi:hypothetical protein